MGAETVSIRPARPGDAAAICEIYNQGIEDRIATLETRLRDAEEQAVWLASRDARHPVVVAQCQDLVVGWGSLNVFNPRAAYDHVAEFSVYVARASRGAGVGRALLERLIEAARELDYHKLVLAAFDWNQSGIALYKRMGFRQVGTYKEQGWLDGRWVDTVVMEKLL